MHWQFLVEDASGETLIRRIVEKYIDEYDAFGESGLTYDIKSFRGIGTIPPQNAKNLRRTGKLLNDLPRYLKGFDNSLKSVPNSCIYVVVDNDKHDPSAFERSLEELAQTASLAIDHVFCIAIEEIEAWLLGDVEALCEAYPDKRTRIHTVLTQYQQDAICGTWEKLADALITGGYERYLKTNPPYAQTGKYKNEWADKVGTHMNIRGNNSPSFCKMIAAMDRQAAKVSR